MNNKNSVLKQNTKIKFTILFTRYPNKQTQIKQQIKSSTTKEWIGEKLTHVCFKFGYLKTLTLNEVLTPKPILQFNVNFKPSI